MRIILIGYMGAGKTTLGHALARKTGMPFYDVDWYVENRMRKTARQLFEERGEDGYRKLEKTLLHEVAEFENVVISCGGGTPCFFDNIDYLNQQGETIYLKTSIDILLKHLSMARKERPLLIGKSDEELRQYIEKQLAERRPFYEKAKHTLDISLLDTHEKIQEAVNQIENIIN